jgi:holo-[acyl-carrier protein] synthase
MIVGSGVDVIEIARIERSLREFGARFQRRICTPAEIRTCESAGRPAVHFAVRFAAKEAAMKAAGTGWRRGVRWVDIETVPAVVRAPVAGDRISDLLDLRLHGAVLQICEELAGPRMLSAHLAVSRGRTHAVATVLLEARER